MTEVQLFYVNDAQRRGKRRARGQSIERPKTCAQSRSGATYACQL